MKIFEDIKNNWKKTLSTLFIFLVLFLVFFWAVNLDFGSSAPAKNFVTEESFAGKLGDEFKEKVGATDVYEIGYGEWAAHFGLADSSKKYDDDPDGDGLRELS